MERLRAAGLDAGRRPRRREPARGRRGRRLDRDRRRQPGAGAGPRARPATSCHRGELLAELCAEKRLIAVAGTHGKTTTTAMLVWALRAIGADPAFFVGGEVPGLGAGRRRRQRRLGRGGVGRRRGRRERRQLPRAEAGDRRGHQRRDGPPLALGLGRRAARRLRRVRPARARRRSHEFDALLAGGPARAAARGPRRATTCSTPAPRWRRSALAGLDLEARGGGAGRLPRRAAAARAEGRARRRRASTTTTPTTRPRCGPPSRRCASSAASA